MRFLIAICFTAMATLATAQDLQLSTFDAVSVSKYESVAITSYYDAEGNPLQPAVRSEPELTEGTETKVVGIRATTEAAKVTAKASDVNRDPVKVINIGRGLFILGDCPAGRVWVQVKAVDFDKQILVDDEIVIASPTPAPDKPDDVDPDPGSGSLADQVYHATKTQSDRQAALTIAKSYRSIAGRAAGLSAMSAEGMAAELQRQLNSKLTDQQRRDWSQWALQIQSILRKQGIGKSKPKFIQAYIQVAKGIERFVNTRSQPGIPQATSVIVPSLPMPTPFKAPPISVLRTHGQPVV